MQRERIIVPAALSP